MKKLYIIILFMGTINISTAQINWNIIDDSVNLTPSKYSLLGSVTIISLGRIITVDNLVDIDFNDKSIYVNNFNNYFKFPFDQVDKFYTSDLIKSIDISGNSEFKKTVISNYRKSLYDKLDLNTISFTYSKRNKIAITDDGKLYYKNEKGIQGKICEIGVDKVTILTEEGELETFSDGDFISLKTQNIQAKNCRTLYNYVYNSFKKDLNQFMQNWENEINTFDITKLIETFGSLNAIKEITPVLKQYEWRWPEINYLININAQSNQRTSSFNFSNSLFLGTTNQYRLNSISNSLFLYYNTFRYLNPYSNTLALTSSNSNQRGIVSMTDNGKAIVIVKDNTGKSISLYHKGFFSDIKYEQPFKFVNY